MNNLFDYAMENPILTSDDYPYDATDICLNLENENSYTLSNYTMIHSGSSSELKAAVALSPVVVSLRAGNSIFRHYQSGVIKSCEVLENGNGIKN